jgi:hypothetical protein
VGKRLPKLDLLGSCVFNILQRFLTHLFVCLFVFLFFVLQVPNFDPDFTIAAMTRDAILKRSIVFPKGEYGHPLLHTNDAGRLLLLYCNKCVVSPCLCLIMYPTPVCKQSKECEHSYVLRAAPSCCGSHRTMYHNMMRSSFRRLSTTMITLTIRTFESSQHSLSCCSFLFSRYSHILCLRIFMRETQGTYCPTLRGLQTAQTSPACLFLGASLASQRLRRLCATRCLSSSSRKGA